MESTEDDVDAMAMLRSSLNASMKGFKTQEQELWLLDGIIIIIIIIQIGRAHV